MGLRGRPVGVCTYVQSLRGRDHQTNTQPNTRTTHAYTHTPPPPDNPTDVNMSMPDSAASRDPVSAIAMRRDPRIVIARDDIEGMRVAQQYAYDDPGITSREAVDVYLSAIGPARMSIRATERAIGHMIRFGDKEGHEMLIATVRLAVEAAMQGVLRHRMNADGVLCGDASTPGAQYAWPTGFEQKLIKYMLLRLLHERV